MKGARAVGGDFCRHINHFESSRGPVRRVLGMEDVPRTTVVPVDSGTVTEPAGARIDRRLKQVGEVP